MLFSGVHSDKFKVELIRENQLVGLTGYEKEQTNRLERLGDIHQIEKQVARVAHVCDFRLAYPS